ncbi:FimV/HubP family polar landmark protein [Neptuniibacter sp. QD37_6]|uniref:FimV/HubP family polar landmark protein n=1 Tax=Neptuniibacter sp. QD37_6 TaxID=3398210 RepID=UPI0039F53087
MLRKLAVSLAVAGIISASNANALGLGEIKIHSALNEPLNAEIQLLEVRKFGPLQIQPRMANIDEFALAGLDKSRFLTDVSFQVKVNPDGSGVITLRSDRPVREPFLNFLVEVNWPSGRLVREYTLLLDPPVYDPTPVRKTVQPATAPVTTSSVKPQTSTSASTGPRTMETGASQVYVDVKDTLWAIAIKHRPSSSISVKKMMIALQKKNPHAFVNGNINVLRAGVVLDLPTMEEINQLKSKEATREFVRQTSEWKNKGKTAAPVEASKKKPVTSSVVEAPKPDPEEDKSAELKIVTPKDSIEPEEGVMTDQSEGEKSEGESAQSKTKGEVDTEKQALIDRNQELEDRLSQSLENVDKITRDNAELNEKLDSIQYELSKLREMLELKDQQLASLQNKVEAAEVAATPPPLPPEKSLIDKILQSPAILGGIGAALIALLGGLFFFLRRGKKDEEATEDENALVQVPEDLDTPEESEMAEEASGAETESESDSNDDLADDVESIEDLDLGTEEDLLDDADLDLTDTDDLEDLDDLDDLDLDMDLDLEEDGSGDALQTVEADEPDDLDALLDDDEFDLGLDEEIDDQDAEVQSEDVEADELDAILEEPSDLDEVEDELEVADASESDALDDILGEVEDVEPEIEAVTADEDEIDAALEADDGEIDLGLDDTDLEFDLNDAAPDVIEEASEEVIENDDADLDFVVDEMPDLATEEDVAQLEAEGPELEADLATNLDVDTVPEELDESGLDDLLDSVSEGDIQELTDAAEEAESDIDELDDLLAEVEEPVTEGSAEAVQSDATDDLEALLAEDLDMGDLELPSEESAKEPVEETTSEAIETMLAENPDPRDIGLPGQLEMQDDLDIESLQSDEGLDELLAKVDEDLDQAMAADLEMEGAEELDSEVKESDDASDDLDAMLDDLGSDLDLNDGDAAASSKEDIVLEGDDLESLISDDLEADLNSELDALLNSEEGDIVLEESAIEEDASVDEDFDELAGLNLLEGADEVETKLDLARAYMDMEDLEGAKDILEEIAIEGTDDQKKEAEALIQSINEK